MVIHGGKAEKLSEVQLKLLTVIEYQLLCLLFSFKKFFICFENETNSCLRNFAPRRLTILANQRTAERKSNFRIRLFEDHVIKILPFLFTTGASLKTDKNHSIILRSFRRNKKSDFHFGSRKIFSFFRVERVVEINAVYDTKITLNKVKSRKKGFEGS